MIFFYNKNTGKIYSYVGYNIDRDESENILNMPSKEKCAANNSADAGDIGIAEFTKENPVLADFKDDKDDLSEEDYEVILT